MYYKQVSKQVKHSGRVLRRAMLSRSHVEVLILPWSIIVAESDGFVPQSFWSQWWLEMDIMETRLQPSLGMKQLPMININ